MLQISEHKEQNQQNGRIVVNSAYTKYNKLIKFSKNITDALGGVRLNKFILAVAFFLFMVINTGCSPRVVDKEQVSPEQKIVIKFSHVVAENSPKGLAAKYFSRLVNEKSGGKIEVQVFANSTLYADGEEMQALQEGAVQLIAPATSKLGSMFPYWQLLDLPYAFSDIESVHLAIEGPIGEKLTDSLEKEGYVALAFWDNGFKQLTNDVHPIGRPGDLKGLKFRVMINSSVLEEQFKLLGAQAIPLPFNSVYRSLEKNEVCGQENTISNIYSKKFYQVQKYMTVTNHGYLGYVVLAQKDYWDGLPEDVRKILEESMVEVTDWERTMAAKINEANYNELVNNKDIEITTLSNEERRLWEESLSPVYSFFEKKISAELVNNLAIQKSAMTDFAPGGGD